MTPVANPRRTSADRALAAAGALLVLTVPVVLTACGSPGSAAAPTGPAKPAPSATLLPAPVPSGSPTPSPVSVDPCRLATGSQVQQALGGTVGVSQLDLTNPAVPGCYWPLTGSTLGDGTVRVVVTGTGGSATTFASVKAAFTGAQSVTGVGEAAFFVGDIGQLVVQQDGTTVTLAASGFVLAGADPPAAAVRQALTSLAATVTAHL